MATSKFGSPARVASCSFPIHHALNQNDSTRAGDACKIASFFSMTLFWCGAEVGRRLDSYSDIFHEVHADPTVEIKFLLDKG